VDSWIFSQFRHLWPTLTPEKRFGEVTRKFRWYLDDFDVHLPEKNDASSWQALIYQQLSY